MAKVRLSSTSFHFHNQLNLHGSGRNRGSPTTQNKEQTKPNQKNNRKHKPRSGHPKAKTSTNKTKLTFDPSINVENSLNQKPRQPCEIIEGAKFSALYLLSPDALFDRKGSKQKKKWWIVERRLMVAFLQLSLLRRLLLRSL